jgi:hypothetical protein
MESTPYPHDVPLGQNEFLTEKNLPVPAVPKSERVYPFCSPSVSLVLGLIPGVGSICNGDYSKAFLQVLIFGSLCALANGQEVSGLGPLFVILSIAFYLYMPLEAYHTAKKRTLALKGITVVSPSLEQTYFSEPWVGGLSICLGVLFLVNQFVPGTIRLAFRGWPLALIAIGIYNLVRYFRS